MDAGNMHHIGPDFFDPLMTNIVSDMCQNTFLRFKATPEYDVYKKDVKDTYNKVTVEDFEYLELLGSGGFGRVVHARKKSTGKHYGGSLSCTHAVRWLEVQCPADAFWMRAAMKIQLKSGLLDEHHDQLSQITSEKDILQICHNPFVLDMHYSFQTPAHAIIVTELVRGGDLGDALKSSRDGYLQEDRVRLYAAEIGLALNHMHELGLIYRDLKPGNVLLGEDGHVILADMGLAAGFNASFLKRDDGESYRYEPVQPRLTRRKTTVGTRGYMAPEIISGKLVKRDQRPGYTSAVDFWSLGVTIFELMCGFQPFSVYSGGNFFQEVANEEIFRLSPRTQHKIELQKMAQGVTFPPHLSKNAQDFLKRLLEVSVEQRLGCHPEKGFGEFTEHPFFESIDWEKLIMKHIEPKYKPSLSLLSDKKIYNSYEHMMSHFDIRDKDFIRRTFTVDCSHGSDRRLTSLLAVTVMQTTGTRARTRRCRNTSTRGTTSRCQRFAPSLASPRNLTKQTSRTRCFSSRAKTSRPSRSPRAPYNQLRQLSLMNTVVVGLERILVLPSRITPWHHGPQEDMHVNVWWRGRPRSKV
jgi:serine/threonine protein kinase